MEREQDGRFPKVQYRRVQLRKNKNNNVNIKKC